MLLAAQTAWELMFFASGLVSAWAVIRGLSS